VQRLRVRTTMPPFRHVLFFYGEVPI
jgi:hypothetical protein